MSSRKILGLAETLAGSAVSAARHPVATAGYVVGFAKGATGVTIDVVRHLREGAPLPQQRTASEPTPTADPASASEPERPAGERTMFGGLNTEAAPPRSPGGGGEPMVHEPQAESREVAHGEGHAEQREIDSWAEEAEEADDIGQVQADLEAPTDDEPLLDPSTAKAVRSEAETLARAADPDKG